ncbi:MAG: baeRF10 domain-containing protein [Solirubrobacteraceae bacterium]
MAPPVVGLGTLRRLGELPTEGRAVLSLYLNLDRAARVHPAACVSKLDALLTCSTARPGPGDRERTRELLRGLPPLADGARSLALFSCAEGSSSAAIPLPDRVEAMAVLEPIPWLEPLAGMFAPGDWGVAVVGGNRTRLLRGGPRTLVEFASLRHELPGAHSLCGFSQLGARRTARRRVIDHAKQLSGLLLRAHRRRPYDRLALAAPAELCHLVESALDEELRRRLLAPLAVDLQAAPVRQIELTVRTALEAGSPIEAARATASTGHTCDTDSAALALDAT